ncbi:hypothetical protein LTR22_008118, partial [Elasticomyces elasticus]
RSPPRTRASDRITAEVRGPIRVAHDKQDTLTSTGGASYLLGSSFNADADANVDEDLDAGEELDDDLLHRKPSLKAAKGVERDYRQEELAAIVGGRDGIRGSSLEGREANENHGAPKTPYVPLTLSLRS